VRRWVDGIVAFGCGALFAWGLVLGGMTRPSKVIGFLDFGGSWDPALAFVMIGAATVYFLAYRAVLGAPRPLLDVAFYMPWRRKLDVRLFGGAAAFGVGWGLVGYCPGPAIVSLGTGAVAPFVFVAAMAGGMMLERALEGALRTSSEARDLVSRSDASAS
jgi:hypothetical protein